MTSDLYTPDTGHTRRSGDVAVSGGAVTAAASGTWKLGDLLVNRIGLGTMRLPQRGEAFAPDAAPSDRGPHVLAIPGTGDPAHLEANVAAGALRLSDGELAVLDALHRGAA